MRAFSVLVVLLSLAASVHAEDFVCPNIVRPECGGTTGLSASTYLRSRDPSTVNLGLCTAIAKAQTASTRSLIETVVAAHANGRCHLKEAGGLVVEMDASEKATVNAAIQAAQETQQALADEANDANCRNVTLAQLDTFFDNLVNNPNNTDDLTGDIAALTTNTAAAIRQMAAATNQRLVQVLRKMAKCLRATR